MAIYHFHIGKLSRAKGRSSVQKMAYICCTMAKDERTNRTFRYLTKQIELVHTETALPKNAPERWKNPTVLWNDVERSEIKCNAQVAYDMDGALPNELTHEQMIEVCRKYAEYMTNKGFCVTWAIHDKNDGNPHVHILATTRLIDKNGNFTIKEKKVPVVDDEGNRVPLIDPETGEQKIRKRKRIADNGKEYYSEEKLWKSKKVAYNPLDGRELYKEIRQSWADVCNEYLTEEEKISPLSNKERGIGQTPSVHIGAVARKIYQRNEYSWKMDNYVQRELVRFRESILKLIEEKLEKAKQLQRKIQEEMEILKEYVNNYIQNKIEDAKKLEQNEYSPMYKVLIDRELNRKEFAEKHYKDCSRCEEYYINLNDEIKKNTDEARTLIAENTDLESSMRNLQRKKADQEAVKGPLSDYNRHFEIYSQKTEELSEEEKKLFKNRKHIDKLRAEAEEERNSINKAADAIRHQICRYDVLMPPEKCVEAAEKLLMEADPSNQIASIKDSIDKNEKRIDVLNDSRINLQKELEKVTNALECFDTYMNVPDEIEDEEYESLLAELYDYMEGNQETGYTVHFKDEGSTDNQDAYLELARTQVRHNMSLKELKQKLSEYCINQYEERENLYEQCSDARNLFTKYNEYEYGYSVFDREKEDEIIDPRENKVKSFVTQEEAEEYMQDLAEKINRYKEENGIEIEEESYDYDFEMHM